MLNGALFRGCRIGPEMSVLDSKKGPIEDTVCLIRTRFTQSVKEIRRGLLNSLKLGGKSDLVVGNINPGISPAKSGRQSG